MASGEVKRGTAQRKGDWHPAPGRRDVRRPPGPPGAYPLFPPGDGRRGASRVGDLRVVDELAFGRHTQVVVRGALNPEEMEHRGAVGPDLELVTAVAVPGEQL